MVSTGGQLNTLLSSVGHGLLTEAAPGAHLTQAAEGGSHSRIVQALAAVDDVAGEGEVLGKVLDCKKENRVMVIVTSLSNTGKIGNSKKSEKTCIKSPAW